MKHLKKQITVFLFGTLVALNVAAQKSAAQSRVPTATDARSNGIKIEKEKSESASTAQKETLKRPLRHKGVLQGEP